MAQFAFPTFSYHTTHVLHTPYLNSLLLSNFQCKLVIFCMVFSMFCFFQLLLFSILFSIQTVRWNMKMIIFPSIQQKCKFYKIVSFSIIQIVKKYPLHAINIRVRHPHRSFPKRTKWAKPFYRFSRFPEPARVVFLVFCSCFLVSCFSYYHRLEILVPKP